MKSHWPHLTAFILVMLVGIFPARADASPFIFGGDISALPDLEKLGAIYREDGRPDDAIVILRHHGMNLFRVRLFVNPQHDFRKNAGATQDLPMILQLATRIKNSGAQLSLALHYSDTWADPAHQIKPEQWKNLDFPALKQQVFNFTITVLQAMQQNKTPPDIIEIGNETTAGMLWPDGKITGRPETWDSYCQLLNAGISAARKQLPNAKILVHIDSGGRGNIPEWFFDQVQKHQINFDIIGLSFYPTWKDSLPELAKNLGALSKFNRDILIIETGYPYKPVRATPQTTWPMTAQGQQQFLSDLMRTVQAAPDHHGMGVVWWYPEAQSIRNQTIWNDGALALFDPLGNPLPALSAR